MEQGLPAQSIDDRNNIQVVPNNLSCFWLFLEFNIPSLENVAPSVSETLLRKGEQYTAPRTIERSSLLGQNLQKAEIEPSVNEIDKGSPP